MADSDRQWLTSGRGTPPSVAWSFGADGGIAGFAQSREKGESFVADDAGGLYLLDRNGKITAMTRGLHGPTRVDWSDDGVGAAVTGETTLCLVDRKLKPAWEIDLGEPILDVAIAPFGNHVAASLGSGTTVVHDRTAKRVARFTTTRPLHHLAFTVTRPHLVGASNYGLIGCWRVDGLRIWDENVLANTGDVDVTGDGSRIAVAAFNRGVQLYKDEGRSGGSLALEGTPERVSLSYEPDVVAATTIEGDVYWTNLRGELRWAAELPHAAIAIETSPLGDGLAIAFETGRVVQLRWGR